MKKDRVLVHLASGIGNIVFATPLLIALHEMDFEIDVLIHADYPETTGLLKGWHIIRRVMIGQNNSIIQTDKYTHIISAIPPFYWYQYGRVLCGKRNLVPLPDKELFYQNEQEYYLTFARALGYPLGSNPYCYLPVQSTQTVYQDLDIVILAPGSKTGEMSQKRWPYFPELAERIKNVLIVGTENDMYDCNGNKYIFPTSVDSLVGKLSLRETAEVMASATVVVGNDNGLSHVASALGVNTIIIFGPTPHTTLGRFPSNVEVVRANLNCEPCWFNNKRFQACSKGINCLHEISVDLVAQTVNKYLTSLAYEN
ncbi:MAG: glycosyltransferase family 9 protein [Deltaproteobacteria bacterium]|nr:glycosyltransferase family 9 protein [Deltaproteobacteria bacterium]